MTKPGFKHDLASIAHVAIQGNPLIKEDELKLISKHGLKYINPSSEDPAMFTIFGDGRTMSTYLKNIEKTCASIEKNWSSA